MNENVIITASDRKYGDFLIEHWLKSLRDTTDLSAVDIAVLDYGLSEAQAFYLKNSGIIVVPCVKDGHVTIIRFRDIADFLKRSSYRQTLVCDSGDIIFQDDISVLFGMHPEGFRAVCEDIKPVFSVYLREEYFYRNDMKLFRHTLNRFPMVNAGVLVAATDLMINLAEQVYARVLIRDKFGCDQIVVNYILHSNGFTELDKGYNFVITTADEEIEIENGVIYFRDHRKIPIVHNAGNVSFFRPLEKFGYGPDRNVLKKDLYRALRILYRSSNLISLPPTDISWAKANLQAYRLKLYSATRESFKVRSSDMRKMLRRMAKSAAVRENGRSRREKERSGEPETDQSARV